MYTTEDGLTKIETTFDEDTVWLSIDQMAELFQRDRSVIGKHIRNIFKEGELDKNSVWAKFAYTATDGKKYNVDYYNLDVIISVGYRVKSHRGTQFRIWAMGILKEYMKKGFALDDDRLKRLGGGNYFDELLARIRDIRSSEKVFWRKVLEIYATSIDYDPHAESSVLFFKQVQNKMHWAAHKHTAAEVIYERADAEKENMGLPQYYVEGDHKAIIPKELFMQVQAELVRRRVVHVSPTGKKRSFSCNHCFAQMVFCGDCGELYRRVHWNNHGCKSIVWRCISRLEPTSAEKDCTNRMVNELLLQEVTVKAFHQILTERDFFLKTLQQNIAKAVVNADTLSPDGIQARLEELQKELIKKATNKQDYDAIADEIFRLRDQKEQSELDSHHREEAMNRIKELQDFISGQESDITEFDEALVKKLIEKITVFADHFTVEFKSGITIDIEA